MNERKSPDQAHFRSKLKDQIAHLRMMDVRGLKADVHKCRSLCCTSMFGTEMLDCRDQLNCG